MTSPDLVAAITEVVDFLEECGGNISISEWLVESRDMLERTKVGDAQRIEILQALRHNIPGMNGLIDQYLTPPQASTYDEDSANAKLVELSDKLYNITTTELLKAGA